VSADAATTAPSSSAASTTPTSPDGGTAACRVLRGPLELPVRSPVTLVVRTDAVDAVLNDDGKPRIHSVAVAAIPAITAAAPGRESAEGGTAAGYPVPCVVAADRFFCPDHTGAVHRTNADGSGDHLAASSRSGSHVSAATLAGTHAALGYLASRQTSEGWVSEAWLAVDDELPLRLSEDGSGATSLVLAQRGGSIVATSVDARAALTTLHVRPVTFEGHTQLGESVVVFVGGPGDRRTAAAVAFPPTGVAWALVPIAKDIGSFGMAVVRVDEPAHVDEPVQWSMYPNGLDPAPVAVTLVGGVSWVARVRPEDASVGSPRAVELGVIGADGVFVSRGSLVTGATKLTDVALASDREGALWVSWVDGAGSWLERVLCH
jgi:hypothetical protein